MNRFFIDAGQRGFFARSASNLASSFIGDKLALPCTPRMPPPPTVDLTASYVGVSNEGIFK